MPKLPRRLRWQNCPSCPSLLSPSPSGERLMHPSPSLPRESDWCSAPQLASTNYAQRQGRCADLQVQVMITKPRFIKEAELVAAKKQRDLEAELVEIGVDPRSIPADQLGTAAGPELEAQLEWSRRLKHLRSEKGGANGVARVGDGGGAQDQIVSEMAIELMIPPASVLPEYLAKNIAYSLPTSAAALNELGVRVKGVEGLAAILREEVARLKPCAPAAPSAFSGAEPGAPIDCTGEMGSSRKGKRGKRERGVRGKGGKKKRVKEEGARSWASGDHTHAHTHKALLITPTTLYNGIMCAGEDANNVWRRKRTLPWQTFQLPAGEFTSQEPWGPGVLGGPKAGVWEKYYGLYAQGQSIEAIATSGADFNKFMIMILSIRMSIITKLDKSR
ncbi:hypothetical protein T492DRAFT_847005 [Pavlovales sp. CCMP2436]|nr:hypothetical protein T492DRAFT_847005 [Pavlovales sp. CCMP2436]